MLYLILNNPCQNQPLKDSNREWEVHIKARELPSMKLDLEGILTQLYD